MSGKSTAVNPCWGRDSQWGCWTDPANGNSQTIAINFRYDAHGMPIAHDTPNAAAPTNYDKYFTDHVGNVLDIDAADVKPGACVAKKSEITTCYILDQYAIQWAWNGGGGTLQSWDASTGDWTVYCNLVDPTTGAAVRGYALAFENNLTEPRLWFQTREGNIYYASPEDPCGTLTLLGNSGIRAQPCFDFDPSGRLLIGDGVNVYEIDQNTGAATSLGRLIDSRDGLTLSVGPGDWMFGPDGSWYMMARDNAGAQHGLCTGTVLWKINPGTLVATRVSGATSCSPSSGTGSSWFAGGRYLLSTSGGTIYEYNEYSDTWSVLTNAPNGINDLAAQWIIPEPIPVTGFIEWDENGNCTTELKTYTVDPVTLELSCDDFEPPLPGYFDPTCQTKGNPFVNDPTDPESGGSSGCDSCPDEVWIEGCSDAGKTLYRRYYDPAGTQLTSYLYGTLTEPNPAQPPGFSFYPCGSVLTADVTITPFCDDDNNKTVYRREEDSVITWFDETGNIPEPANLTPGECPSTDPNLATTDQEICLGGNPAVRRTIEIYVPDMDGLPVLDSTQIIYFDQAGTIWDSDSSIDAEPTGWFLGECTKSYIDFRFEQLCELADEKLLLIDSGGGFAEYSFYDQSLVNVPLSIASAGGSADPDNFLLYNFVSPNQLVVTDVNTKTIVNAVTLTGATGTEPLTFSAAAFDVNDGFLYSQDTAGADRGIYRTNVVTGVVTFFSTYSGVSGNGTSMAIDFNGNLYLMGSAGRVYEIDRATGAGTLVYTSTGGIANGATFDADGFLYLTGGNNTYKVNLLTGTEENIIDNWGPGANSIAYYRTKAESPSCFFRKYGVTETGDIEYLSDHYISDGSIRNIAGSVGCCNGSEGSEDSETAITNFPTETLCDSSEGFKVESTRDLIKYWELSASGLGALRRRTWNTSEPASPVTTAQGANLREAFDLTQAPNTDGTVTNLNLDDINNTGSLRDYEVIDGYLIVSEPVIARYEGGTEGYWAVEIGVCCGSLQLATETAEQESPQFTIPAGIHAVRMWNIDAGGTNSTHGLEVSNDGGASWANNNSPSQIQLSTSKPSWICKHGYICDGNYYQVDGVTQFAIDNSISLCEPTCNANAVV